MTTIAPPATIDADATRQTAARNGWGWPATAVSIAIVFGLLAAWQYDVLHERPMQDQGAAIWTEADYLVETGFDYHRLLYDETHFMDDDPGPRSYMISVYPTLLGLSMIAIPNVETHIVVMRLLSFLFGAIILVMFFRLIPPSVPRGVALLLTVALATTPLFIVQLDLIGMDVPLTVVMLVAAVYLFRERWVAAALWGFAAFAVKATGQLSTLAGITYLVLRIVLGLGRESKSSLLTYGIGLAAHLVMLAIESALIAWGDTSVQYLASGDWPENLTPLRALRTATPDIALLLVVTAVLTVVHMVVHLRQRRTGGSALGNLLAGLHDYVINERKLVICWISVVGLMASSAMYIYTPRYVFCVVPFLFLALACVLPVATGGARLIALAALAIWIGGNFLNQNGRFCADMTTAPGNDIFEGIPGLTPRSCVYVERSREYLRDVRSTTAALKLIDTKYADRPIFVAAPHTYMLCRPRIGYVRNRLEVYDSSVWTKGLDAFCDVMLRHPDGSRAKDPVFVWYGHGRMTLPPLEPGDEVIYDDSKTNPDAPLILFIKHLPPNVERTRQGIEDWYIERTWSTNFLIARLRARFSYLLANGRLDRAQEEIEEALALRPNVPELLELRDRLSAARQQKEPLSQARRATVFFPSRFSSPRRAGWAFGSLEMTSMDAS